MSVNSLVEHRPLIGIAIATFNRKEILKECLDAINQNLYPNIFICVVDDGSSDGTSEMLATSFPLVEVIKGDGSLWWGAATNKAIKSCLESKCDYVILLNDDCLLLETTLDQLVQRANEYPDTVICPVVTDVNNPAEVWWAGSSWGAHKYLPFFWLMRQRFKHRSPSTLLPKTPYNTSEFTGRATLIPKIIFNTVGLIDSKNFPQYGSDNDFSLRVTSKYNAIVDPDNKVLLYVEKAGQNTSGSLISLPIKFFKMMFFRKHGEALFYWWKLHKRHTPKYAFLPSYLLTLIIIFLRVFKISTFFKKLKMEK